MDVVVSNFGGFFPELIAARATLVAVISEEETSFGACREAQGPSLRPLPLAPWALSLPLTLASWCLSWP